MNNASLASHKFLINFKKLSDATLIPPTPWMASTITAATLCPLVWKYCFKAASSLNGRKSMLAVSFTGATIFLLSVAATANEVLP
jgi:hypothetical protein